MSDDVVSFDFKSYLKHLSEAPGVYQMFDKHGRIIYVGKAKNLKKRVSSYFLKKTASSKTSHMVSHIHDIKVIVTETETEALLLECNLIKKHAPKYNILLRDDKSYPYVLLSGHPTFPRLSFYRGSRTVQGKLFGPYPNVYAVKETLELLQKLFKLRSCRDTYFNNRTRPCLQYQIKRCKAPCVNLVSKEEYQQDLAMAIDFLNGKSDVIIRELEQKMMAASEGLAFEKAAYYRNQIQHLRAIQQSQMISTAGGDADVLGIARQGQVACVALVMVRQGQVLGSHAFFPKLPADPSLEENDILQAFITQYYLQVASAVPEQLIVPVPVEEALEQALQQVAIKKCRIISNPKGVKQKWLQLANQNALLSLNSELATKASVHKRYLALQQALALAHVPQRMECFDISHHRGEATVASCVVFGAEGPLKNEYRKFNIEGITPGDDYAAMSQALTRRYQRLQKEEKPLPDLLFIDGGKGQVNVAKRVMENLQLDQVAIVGVAKGVSRKPGLETLIVAMEEKEMQLDSDSPALHLIQHIRDEAHRFAVLSHRQKRSKQQMSSVLEDIEGVGAKRRQALLKRFGGLQNLKHATVEELIKVPGVSAALAKRIYAFFHEEVL